MTKILEKWQLSEHVFRMRLEAPLIAKARRAGQFVILRVEDEWGERIPLTIADADPVAGTIDIVFQAVGATTSQLAALSAGETVADLVGPLGRPTEIRRVGTVIVVGGGIGIAPAHPIAEAMRAADNRVVAIVGARNAGLVIMEAEMRRAADEVVVMTEDGSAGRRGLVTEPLRERLEELRAQGPAALAATEVIAVGPPVMMRFVAETTRPFGVKTVVSLNAIMIDGTGMCGGCRVKVGGETRFVCVDGPEFDAHQVDFDSFVSRLSAFREEETRHRCRLFGVSGREVAR